MLRTLLTASLIGAVLVLVGLASTTAGQEPVPPTAASEPPPPAQIASVRFIRPARTVYRRARLTPPAHPSPRYVRDVILPYEAARAGASLAHLRARANCESGYRWWAQNGQYHGIGQFASSTFWRGVATLGSRRIYRQSVRIRKVRVIRVRTYTDGSVKRARRWPVHQRVVTRRRGSLRVVAFDAWTEARIMAQAMVGRSAVHDSEWSCR